MKNENQETAPFETLMQLRDDLRVRAHLFGAEAKEQWRKLEKDWELLESERKRLAPEFRESVAETGQALRPLMRGIELSLQRIQEGLERHHARDQVSAPSASARI